jgi:4-hydroxy-4-methyl-2-oxoglutarate aldolase
VTDRNLDRARKLDCATLSDAMDKLGIEGVCRGIKPRDHKFRLAGRAFTVLYGPVDAVKPGTVGDYVDDMKPGEIAVLDNGGREDCTVWGDILTQFAHTRSLGGTVIDGPCRDVHLCLDLGYPIYSRSYSMKTGKDRVEVYATQVPVSIGDAKVCPGDMLVGDSDGVVVLSQGRENEILDIAEAIFEAEAAIRQLVSKGASIADARAQLNYHKLQTAQGKGIQK